ncbi:MAG: HAMP domain-containing histidine kinase [Rhizobiales bacterium]|nr:HAMP domain-containing histidine kinase [Hyphomicrobiales bacterium]
MAAGKITLIDDKLRLVFVGLALMAVTVAGISWQAARMISGRLAISQATQQAVVWRYTGLNILSMGAFSFVERRISTEDQRDIFNVLQTTDAYRISMLDVDGRAFWSSNPKYIGRTDNSADFKAAASTMELQAAQTQTRASDVDRLLLNRHYENIEQNDLRDTTVVYVPVIKRNQFTGALVLYSDATDLIATYRAWSNKAAVVMVIVITCLIIFLGWLISSYATQRRADVRALKKARDEAVNAHDEAVTAHAEVEKINEDVVKLNRDLESNMAKLREAQHEIIRKGKMAQMGQLTATIAHDIRNPLGTVRTAAFLIGRKFKDTPGIEKPLERINTGVMRCDEIITELLDFARTSDPSYEKLGFDAWVHEQVLEQAENLPEVVALECHLGLGEAVAEFDPGGMQRVLVNFLTNASEAMVGKGDDPEKFTTPSPKIVVSTLRSQRGVELHVTDNGPGMSAEVQAKILEPLFTTKNFGVGLGLPSVEKVLENHGGGLEIRSVEDEGTTMVGWVPITRVAVGDAGGDESRPVEGSFLAA